MNSDANNFTDNSLMPTYFYANEKATILFKSWTTTTWRELFGSCLAVFFLALACEVIHLIRNGLFGSEISKATSADGREAINSRTSYGATECTAESSASLTSNMEFAMIPLEESQKETETGKRIATRSYFWNSLWLETALYIGEFISSYCLMMIFVTYNAYICMSVIVGTGIGYAFFGSPAANEILDKLRTNKPV